MGVRQICYAARCSQKFSKRQRLRTPLPASRAKNSSSWLCPPLATAATSRFEEVRQRHRPPHRGDAPVLLAVMATSIHGDPEDARPNRWPRNLGFMRTPCAPILRASEIVALHDPANGRRRPNIAPQRIDKGVEIVREVQPRPFLLDARSTVSACVALRTSRPLLRLSSAYGIVSPGSTRNSLRAAGRKNRPANRKFFATPYRSWGRSLIERTNRLVHRQFPKPIRFPDSS